VRVKAARVPFRSEGGNPVPNGRAAALAVYPGLEITQVGRDPNSALGKANPGSYHTKSSAAIDARPIAGMTFAQYVQGYRDAGYKIIEARDEVSNPSRHATGPHWHVVLGR
jgi:soluble lytic murein transglycosylase